MNKTRIKLYMRLAFGIALAEIRAGIKNPKSTAKAKEAAKMAVKYAREFADTVESDFLSE